MEPPSRLTLYPLEFQECKVDSPYFRCKLLAHEEALSRTSTDIKQLIEELKTVIDAEQHLCASQRSLANHLKSFHYDCIGTQQTDDEVVIANSLHQFGQLLGDVERERSNMLEFAHKQFIQPLEHFRKDVIGKVKVAKKSYEKASTKFYQSQEKFLSATGKKDDVAVEEMAAALGLEKRQYTVVALDYVKAIQAVHERKKFEFVETLIGFVHSTMCYFRLGYAIHNDYRNFMQDLKLRVQNSRENYNSFCTEADALVSKMLRTSFGGAATMTNSSNSSVAASNEAKSNFLRLPSTTSRRQRSNISLRPPVSQYLMLTPSNVSNLPLNAAGIFNSALESQNQQKRPSFTDIYGYRFCEGYLLLLDRRKKMSSMTRFVVPPHSSQQWSKHYCRYDAATGQLRIRPCSPNSLHHVNAAATTTNSSAMVLPNMVAASPMSIDDDVDAKVLYVQQCCIHDPDGGGGSSSSGQNVVERRFCFDVYATEPIEESMPQPLLLSNGGGSFKSNGSVESNRMGGGAKMSTSLREGSGGERQMMHPYQQSITTTAKGQTNMRILIFQATSNEDRNIWVRTMAESSQHAASLNLSVASQLTNNSTTKRNSVDSNKNSKKRSMTNSKASSANNSSASPASTSSVTSSSKRRQQAKKSLFGIANGSFSDFSTNIAENEFDSDAENVEDEADADIIDESGIKFIAKCIDAIEKRGLREQGLYRTAGVSSRVNKLLHEYYSLGPNSLNLLHEDQWEVKTITSALKTFLRSLPEPLMTLHLHDKFIETGKLEDVCARVEVIDALIQHELPASNRQLLAVVIGHLSHVVEFVQYNLMTSANLATCFGPTLMRATGDTVAALVDIKFANVVVECMIDNFQYIFNNNNKTRTTNELNQTPLSPPSNQRLFYYFGEAGEEQNIPPPAANVVDYAALTLSTSKTRRIKQQLCPTNAEADSEYGFAVRRPQQHNGEAVDQLQQRLSQSSLFSPTSSKDFVLADYDNDFDYNNGALSPTTSAGNSSHLSSDNRPPSRLTRARNIRYPKRINAQPAKAVQLPLAHNQQLFQQRIAAQQQQHQPDLLLSNQAGKILARQPDEDVHRYNVSSHHRHGNNSKNMPINVQYAQPHFSHFATNGSDGFQPAHQYAAPLPTSGALPPADQLQIGRINYYTTPFETTSPYRSVAVSSMTPSTHQLVMAAAESAKHARFASMPMAARQFSQHPQQRHAHSNGLPASSSYYQYDDGEDDNGRGATIPKILQHQQSVPNDRSSTLHVNNNETTASRMRLFNEQRRRGSDSPSQAEAQRRRWTTLILHPFDAVSHHLHTEIPLNASPAENGQRNSTLTPVSSEQQKRASDFTPTAKSNCYYLAADQHKLYDDQDELHLQQRREAVEDAYGEISSTNSRAGDRLSLENTSNNKALPRQKSPHQNDHLHGRSSLSSVDMTNTMMLSTPPHTQQLNTSSDSAHSSPIVTSRNAVSAAPFTYRKTTPVSTVYNFTAGGSDAVTSSTPSTVVKRRAAVARAMLSPAKSTPSLFERAAPNEMKSIDFNMNNDAVAPQTARALTIPTPIESINQNVQLKKYTHHTSDDDDDSANAGDERRDSLSPPQVASKRNFHSKTSVTSHQERASLSCNTSATPTSSLSNTFSSSASSVASLYENNNGGTRRVTQKKANACDTALENAVKNGQQQPIAAPQHVIQEFQLHDI